MDVPAGGQARRHAVGTPGGRLARGVAVLGLLVLAGALARATWVAGAQLAYPLDLHFELPNLRSVDLLREGRGLYDASTWDAPPFVLTQYAPLGLAAVAALPRDPARPFLAGRLLACAGMAAVVLLLLRSAGPGAGALAGLCAAGGFLLLRTPVNYVAQFRVDAPALALSLASLMLLVRGRGVRRAALAGVLFALGVATKQSYVAAGPAALVFLLGRDRREALAYVAAAGALLGAGALVGTLASGSGLWTCLMASSAPPRSLDVFTLQWSGMLRQPPLAALVAATALALWKRPAARSPRASPWPLWALGALLVLLPVSSTYGTYDMHFLEWETAMLALCAHAFRGRAQGTSASTAGLAALVVVGAVELAATWDAPAALSVPSGPVAEHRLQRHANVRLAFEERGLPHRHVLALSDAREAAAVSDEVALCPAWLYDQLWSSGRLDPAPVVRAVDAQAFDVVTVRSMDALPPEEGDVTPRAAVLRAVAERYTLVADDGIVRYMRPAP